MAYCALYQFEREIKEYLLSNQVALSVTDARAWFNQTAPQLTKRWDIECSMEFAPRLEVRVYDATRDYIDWFLNQLLLDRPLLEALEVTVFDTLLTQWDGINYNEQANFDFYPAPMTREYPYTTLQGIPYVQPWNPYLYNANLVFTQAYLQCIKVRGWWGYREYYTRDGWQPSGNTVLNDDGINASATTIQVADINGAQFNGETPRFSPGQWIRITTDDETELMEIVATAEGESPAHDTITVVRGQRGTTAAAHDKSDQIDIFYPQPEVVKAFTRWMAYAYNRRGVYESITVNAANTYASLMPQDIPEESWHVIKMYRNQMPMRI